MMVYYGPDSFSAQQRQPPKKGFPLLPALFPEENADPGPGRRGGGGNTGNVKTKKNTVFKKIRFFRRSIFI